MSGALEQTHPGTTGRVEATGRVPRLHDAFPHLKIVHEIEVRGRIGMETVAALAVALSQSGAELVSLHARCHERTHFLICRIRYLTDEVLEAALGSLRRIPLVESVLLSHHLGRASESCRHRSDPNDRR